MPEIPVPEVPEDDWDLLELLANVSVRFWSCLNKDHKAVTWTGDVASCDTCGLTSEMTGSYRELARQHERREIARHIREVAADSDWGHVNLRKFIQRHARLHTGDSVVAVMLALADEIAEPSRETYPKETDHDAR